MGHLKVCVFLDARCHAIPHDGVLITELLIKDSDFKKIFKG